MSVFIITEAGVNHNGSIETAKKMIDVAVSAGADAIKFQTFTAKNMVTEFAPKADYQKQATDRQESQFEMIKKLELSFEMHQELSVYCHKNNIVFLSSPFDLDSIDLLKKLNLEIFKIPSGEITNLPYLQKIGGLKKKIIVSSGMADLNEIKAALDVLIEAGTKKSDIIVLHCNTEYPLPYKDANLRAMQMMSEKLGVPVGYSDHTLGIEVSVAATALGAVVIEKHFTLNKDMDGPDHQISLNPDELRMMIKAIRNVEMALGNDKKEPTLSEIKNRGIVRKSIVAAKYIRKGEIFTTDNITVKRPGEGISPMQWYNVIGKKAKEDFNEDEYIKF